MHEPSMPDPERAQPIEPSELLELDAAIRATVEGATSDPAPQDFVTSLRRAAGRARQAGLAEAVDARLREGGRGASDAARTALARARLARNDQRLSAHAVGGLRVMRVDLGPGSTVVAELGIVCAPTPGGSFAPQPRDGGELRLISMTGELQLLVDNDLRDAAELTSHPHGVRVPRLHGALALMLELRATRRLTWGTGVLTLTDRRAIGLILDTRAGGPGDGADRSGMPIASVEGGRGSIIAFSCPCGVFDYHEMIARRLRPRTPYVNLAGACCLALRTRRILDRDDREVRPAAGAIDAAVHAFLA